MKAPAASSRPAATKQGLAPKKNTSAAPVTYTDIGGNKVELSIALTKQYLCPNATDAEAYMFLELCKFQGLNPWLREVYPIKYGNSPMQVVTGKETFTKRAQKNPKYKGSKAGVVVINRNDELENRVGEIVLEGEELVGGWADVYVDGYIEPISATVGFKERCQYKDGKPASKWATAPALMIRKCALVAALREAFPDDVGGLYSAEELGMEEIETPVTPFNPTENAVDAEFIEVDPETGEAIETEGDIASLFEEE